MEEETVRLKLELGIFNLFSLASFLLHSVLPRQNYLYDVLKKFDCMFQFLESSISRESK